MAKSHFYTKNHFWPKSHFKFVKKIFGWKAISCLKAIFCQISISGQKGNFWLKSHFWPINFFWRKSHFWLKILASSPLHHFRPGLSALFVLKNTRKLLNAHWCTLVKIHWLLLILRQILFCRSRFKIYAKLLKIGN